MPKQIAHYAFLTLILTFFTLKINAQCSVALQNPNQPTINIITNNNCEVEFDASPFLTTTGSNCTLLYFKDAAMSQPYLGKPKFNASNLNQTIGIFISIDDANPATPLPSPVTVQVKIVDGTAPTLICPTLSDYTADGLTCIKNIPNGLQVNAFDNCGGTILMTYELTGATLGNGTGSANGQNFNVGQTIIKYKGTDFTGNTGTCNVTVNVKETVIPTLVSCPAPLTLDAPAGTCERIVVTGLTPSFTDNCTALPNVTFTVQGATLAAGQGSVNGTVFKVGTSTVRYFCTDNYSNTNIACSFTVTVKDADKPTLICPADLTLQTLTNDCFNYASVSSLTPVRFDNCGQNNVAIAYNISGATTATTQALSNIAAQKFNKGNNIVTFIATDLAGNNNTCAMNVFVEDKVKPIIACNTQNIAAQTALNQCDKTISLPAPTFSDNCTATGNIALNYDIKGTTNTSGVGIVPPTLSFKTGKSIVTYRVIDIDGNQNICSYEVFLKETPSVKPTVVCRTDTTVFAAKNQCNRLISNGLQPKSFADNCSANDALTLLVAFSNATTMPDTILSLQQGANGFSFNLGTTNVRYILKDASGNADTCTFKVIVRDSQAPEITCVNDVTVSSGVNCSRKIANLKPTATDNCDIANLSYTYTLTGATSQPSTNTPIDSVNFIVGETFVQYIVSDAANNKDTCMLKVTVTETVAPTITCPNNITVNTTDSTCAAVLQNINAPIFADNCTPNSGLKLSFETNSATKIVGNGSINGKILNHGLNTVIYKIKDFSQNETTCNFTITVKDATLPTITCPPNLTVYNVDNQCVTEVTTAAPVVVDNCSAALSYTVAGATIANGSGTLTNVALNTGMNKVFYKATDIDNNTAVCAVDIFVRDTIKPTIICPANVTANATPNTCTVSLTNLNPTTADNCNTLDLTYTSVGATLYTNETGLAANKIFNVGKNIVTYRVADIQQNTATCSFTIDVLDVTLPAAICKSSINMPLDNSGNLVVDAKIFDNGSTDNCTTNTSLTYTLSKNTFNCSNIGANNLVLTIKDASNNAATCNVSLNVQNSANNLGFSITKIVTEETYFGAEDGSVSIDVTGGVGSFTYLWSNGLTTQDIMNVPSGNYTVTVTDAVSGCRGLAAATIMSGPKLTIVAPKAIGKNGDIISLPVRVQNFNRVSQMSFTLRVDKIGIAGFEALEDFGLVGLDTNTVKIDLNRITVNWSSATPVTLPNGSALFYIKTKIIGNLNDFTLLNFTAIPTPILVKQTLKNGVTEVPTTLIQGSVGISNGNAMADIKGTVLRENGIALSSVKCYLSGTYRDSLTTSVDGNVSFSLPMGAKAILKPFRNDNPKNGVTASDLVVIQRHILGLNILTSPYQKIAADVTRNGIITTADLVEIRHLILGMTTKFNNNTSWRFIPQSFVFPKTTSNSIPPAPDSLVFDYLLDNQVNKNFVAIKVGDLNFTAKGFGSENSPTARTAKTVAFTVENKAVKANDRVVLRLKNQAKINLEAMILHIGFEEEKLRFEKIDNGVLSIEEEDKNIVGGKISILKQYNNSFKIADNQNIIDIIFYAKENIDNLSDVLTLKDATLFADNEEQNIVLDWKKTVSDEPIFTVSNVMPNPVMDIAIVPVVTNQKGMMQTTLFDMQGRMIVRQQAEIFRDYHEVKIDCQNLPTGIYIVENMLNGITQRQKILVRSK
jgi:HYR domain/SprB repeat/Secretion system C-terminal sorting domain